MDSINTPELGRALQQRRAELGLSLAAVGFETGISKSTLSRVERGIGQPDASVVAAVTAFLNVPIDRVMGSTPDDKNRKPVVYYPNESTPDIVQAHLNADPGVGPKEAIALGELFRVAYNAFRERDHDG
jgi:transcriptional regulator with XRE-family HTH domain